MDSPLALFATIGATPGETEEGRLRRALLVGLAVAISVLAIVWGLVYVAFGEPLGGAIPLAYTVISLLSAHSAELCAPRTTFLPGSSEACSSSTSAQFR